MGHRAFRVPVVIIEFLHTFRGGSRLSLHTETFLPRREARRFTRVARCVFHGFAHDSPGAAAAGPTMEHCASEQDVLRAAIHRNTTSSWTKWKEQPEVLQPLLGVLYSGPSVVVQSGAKLYGEHARAALHRSREEVAASGERSGLIMLCAFRQEAVDFQLHARALGLTTRASPFLHNASLLIAINNAALLRYGQSDPAKLLQYYGSLPLRLRMLLVTRLNVGFLCGELQQLHALVHVWSLFPWVLYTSGPDAMPTTHGILQVAQDVVRFGARANLTAERPLVLLGSHFPAPPKHIRFSMDLFVFFPSSALLRACPGADGPVKDASIWTVASANCMHHPEMPESTIAEVIIRLNRSTKMLAGSGVSTAASKVMSTGPKPDSLLWHVHNRSSISQWLKEQEAAGVRT
eukprot:4699010-Prymnesium_polylepis.2